MIPCLTQQHRLLLLPVALLESSGSLLFYQVAVNIRTPGLKNLQEPKWVHKLGTWNQTNTSLKWKILTFKTQSAFRNWFRSCLCECARLVMWNRVFQQVKLSLVCEFERRPSPGGSQLGLLSYQVDKGLTWDQKILLKAEISATDHHKNLFFPASFANNILQ